MENLVLNIFAALASVASAAMAISTFIIFRRNSKPRINLEIINQQPYHFDNQINIYRNIFYLDEKQKNAIIHVEIENHSSLSGTITEIFVRPDTKRFFPPSQTMAYYKDYKTQNYRFALEDSEGLSRYSKNYLHLQQPITVQPYGYMIGFLFVPFFNIDTNDNEINVVLEYRIVGYNKTYSQKVKLTRVFFALCDQLTSWPEEHQQLPFQKSR